jgi:hypothetical protein
MNRETTQELMARMRIAEHLVPAGYAIRHVRTGGEYMVRGHSLRVGDLTPMVSYSPLTGPVIVFSRAAQDVQRKFVRVDGNEWKSIHSTPHATEDLK